MTKKNIPMNEDIKKYPVFALYNNEIIPAPWITNTNCYDHNIWELHHFVRQEVRKNSLDFYKRVEHLQKLILVPKQLHDELEDMGADTFAKRHPELKYSKHDLVFNRLKWREGYYEV